MVRVDATTSSYLRGPGGLRYPGEQLGHSESSSSLLARSGHSGRQWNPMTFACSLRDRPVQAVNAGHIPGLDAGAPFDPYTLPAPAFRTLVRDAAARSDDEEFTITGALLPGATGDEAWRASAAAARFFLWYRRDAGDVQCTDRDTGLPCSDWLRSVVAAPPSRRLLPALMRKVLLSQPYPILSQDAGAHRRVTCFGP